MAQLSCGRSSTPPCMWRCWLMSSLYFYNRSTLLSGKRSERQGKDLWHVAMQSPKMNTALLNNTKNVSPIWSNINKNSTTFASASWHTASHSSPACRKTHSPSSHKRFNTWTHCWRTPHWAGWCPQHETNIIFYFLSGFQNRITCLHFFAYSDPPVTRQSRKCPLYTNSSLPSWFLFWESVRPLYSYIFQ